MYIRICKNNLFINKKFDKFNLTLKDNFYIKNIRWGKKYYSHVIINGVRIIYHQELLKKLINYFTNQQI